MYQFVHLEMYARQGAARRATSTDKRPKWSARQIAAEAERVPGACPHVGTPAPPILRHGVMPSIAVEEAEAAAASCKDSKGRKLRADAPILAAGVISLPDERRRDWPSYRDQAIKVILAEYGDRLRSVVEHEDEAHPHIHFYLVPRPGEGVESVHPGYKARQDARRAGQLSGAVRRAYCEAMRQWQDKMFSELSAEWGLARLGPKRSRMTRGEWRANVAILAGVAEARRSAEAVQQAVDKAVAQGRTEGRRRGRAEGLADSERAGVRVGAAIVAAAKPVQTLVDWARRPGEAEERATKAERKAAKAIRRSAEESKARIEAEMRAEKAERYAASLEQRERALAERERRAAEQAAELAPKLAAGADAAAKLAEARELRAAAARMLNEAEALKRGREPD